MRLLLVLLLTVTSLASTAQVRPSQPIAACAEHVPYGAPNPRRQDMTLVCRQGYALEHDNKAKIPAWVAYTLTTERALGCSTRGEKFIPDPAVPADKSATLKDYAKSGYDMGHMANSADMRWSDTVSDESNVLSNVTPQVAGLNRGAWKSLEIRTRSWAIDRDNLLIYVGPIYKKRGASTIGPGQVVVPDAFFKVIIDRDTNEVMSFIYPHQKSTLTPEHFMTSLAEVQKQTAFVLPVPKGAKAVKEPWALNASSVSAKAAVCAK